MNTPGDVLFSAGQANKWRFWNVLKDFAASKFLWYERAQLLHCHIILGIGEPEHHKSHVFWGKKKEFQHDTPSFVDRLVHLMPRHHFSLFNVLLIRRCHFWGDYRRLNNFMFHVVIFSPPPYFSPVSSNFKSSPRGIWVSFSFKILILASFHISIFLNIYFFMKIVAKVP